jgi:predicted RNase H-like HicB family nuclease
MVCPGKSQNLCHPGGISQGKTKEKAIANPKEAIQGYLKVLEEDGLPVPEERFESLLLAG